MQPDSLPGQQETPLSNSLPQAGERTNVNGNLRLSGWYAELMAHAVGQPNDELFAQMIASQIDGAGALPPGLGLAAKDFSALLTCHFPGIGLAIGLADNSTDPRAPERDDVLGLLLEHRAHRNMSEQWMAEIVTAACMANDHLWQDLGLRSRTHLGKLMTQNFPALAAKNVHDMKWKKFLYKQLCEQEGINTCRAPSCEYCTDYLNCFGPEE
ncbi:MAG: nitrogen fixation protein NifQ [Nitrosomonadales bacterium]|nr:nitrogen fixation protein NifQ [Nitrosomonadales bacterium]